MNIQVQICGLIIMLCLLFFHLRQKKVGLYSESVFIGVFVASLACVVLDIMSSLTAVWALRTDGNFPWVLWQVVVRIYESSFLIVAFFGMVYSMTDLYPEKEYRKVIWQLAIVVLLELVVIFVLPVTPEDVGGHINVEG